LSDSYLCYNHADRTKPTLRQGQSKKKKTLSWHVLAFDCKVGLKDKRVCGEFMTSVVFFKETQEGNFFCSGAWER